MTHSLAFLYAKFMIYTIPYKYLVSSDTNSEWY
ncbi:protein of unknown function [Shewanella benthica]|uniref:Uncharacterized protein n=1 Tax=Shewanella benthica TaxID=43661 RepID=A0A330M3V3_9GAMM|nr:protein of unknown function [Shewanella benthica]